MISVIIPNYNHASYLSQRIESILDQSVQDFELIILDDCSTDDSKNVIEKYRQHPKVAAIVYNNQNSGSTFKQWEKGLEYAKGDWIWIAESDDYAAPDFLEILSSRIKEETNIVYSSSFIVDEKNTVLDTGIQNASWVSKKISIQDFEQNIEMQGVDFFKKYLLYSNVIYNASAVLFRKESMLKYIDKVTDWKLYGDWLLWTYITLEENISYVSKPLNYFRCHSNNVRTRFNKKAEKSIKENLAFGKELQHVIQSMNIPSDQKKALLAINQSERDSIFKQLYVQNTTENGLLSSLKSLMTNCPRLFSDPGFIKNILAAGYRKK